MSKTFLYMILFCCLISTASAATINVTGNDINAAIQAANPGDTIKLSPGTYEITNPVILKSDITLEGDLTTIYVSDKELFNSDDEAAMIMGDGIKNVTVTGIHFKGPGLSLADVHDSDQAEYGGHDEFHNAMRFVGCSDITVSDCSCELLLSDFVRASTCRDITVDDNIVDASGHDGCQFFNCDGITAHNNYFHVFINCGVRVSSCENAVISYNTFTSPESSGWNGVQIQGDSTSITVEKNVFTEMGDNYGVAGYSNDGTGSTINNNAGYDVPAGLIHGLSSAVMSENIIYTSPQNWEMLGLGYTGNYVPAQRYSDEVEGTESESDESDIELIEEPAENVIEEVDENTTISPVENVTVVPEVPVNERNETETCAEKEESIVICQETTVSSNNVEVACDGTITMKCIEPVVIEQEHSVMKVYTIPANCSPVFFEGDTLITKNI